MRFFFVICTVVFLTACEAGGASGASVYFLDVGQGDSVLIRSSDGDNILIDGGPSSLVLDRLGEILPFWSRDIDLLVLTHPHDDHLVGLISVLERYEVSAVLITGVSYKSVYYDEFLRLIDLAGVKVYFAEAKVDFKFGDVYLDVIYPFFSIVDDEFSNLNNSSIVIRAVFGGEKSVLLTGDCEVECESEILGEDIDTDLLKAGHHGSKTASSLEFVKAVSPEDVVISVGAGNKFGHPHAETLSVFEEVGVSKIFRTDLDGTVEMKF